MAEQSKGSVCHQHLAFSSRPSHDCHIKFGLEFERSKFGVHLWRTPWNWTNWHKNDRLPVLHSLLPFFVGQLICFVLFFFRMFLLWIFFSKIVWVKAKSCFCMFSGEASLEFFCWSTHDDIPTKWHLAKQNWFWGLNFLKSPISLHVLKFMLEITDWKQNGWLPVFAGMASWDFCMSTHSRQAYQISC